MKILINRIIRLFLLYLLVFTSHADDLVITSFDENGTLEWNGDLTNGFYQVQWAATLNGEWHSDLPYSHLPNTNSTMSVEVPRFFRVVWHDGYTVSGIVTYSTTTLVNEPVRLTPRSPEASPEQSLFSDENGMFKFEGLSDGKYMLATTTHDDYAAIGRIFTIAGNDVVKNIEAWKQITLISPASDTLIQTNEVTFSWSTLPEAVNYTFWFRVVDESYTYGYGPKFGLVEGLGTNEYQTFLTLTNGVYKWGVDLFDSAGNQIGFTGVGSEFELNIP